jgi:hypothetical protein
MPSLSLNVGLNNGRKLPFGGGAAPSSLLTGLLAYWKFDNNGSGGVSLLDSSGNSRTLSAPNGTSGVSLGTGIINGSANFSGDDFTYLSRSGTFLNGTRDAYSISAWVKTTIAADLFIVDQATGNNYGGSTISLDMLPDGTIYGTIFWSGAPDFDRASGTTAINNGNFNHVAMTWLRTGSIKVYVNGALNGSSASSGNYANVPTENISLNGNADGSFAIGKGCNIDEVGVWNKELSASEITSLYNAGAGKTYPFN